MMGIMSDSHDNIMAIRKAVRVFNNKEVDLVSHAGDLIAPFTVKEFEKLDSNFIAVFGNNDGEREGLKNSYQDLCYLEDFKEFDYDGLRIALIHGTYQPIVNSLKESDRYDLVIRGHNHQIKVEEDSTMVINPGETCGYLSGKKTVILLDPDNLNYDIINL